MKRLYRVFISSLLVMALALPAFQAFGAVSPAGQPRASVESAQKNIRGVDRMNELHPNYKYLDFKQISHDLDDLLFDFTNNPDYVEPSFDTLMPFGYWDDTNYNGFGRMFGIPSYIGQVNGAGDSTMRPGTQEGVTVLEAVLSGLLTGIDKTGQNGYDLVEMMNGFRNVHTGQGFVLNRINTTTGQSAFYEIYPQILFADIYATAARLYGKDSREMASAILEGADKWLAALPNFVDDKGNVSFNFVSYDFANNKPATGRWIEPSSGAVAYLLYSAYRMTGEQKYLDGAVFCMRYSEKQTINPNYDLIQDYDPLMGAILNFRYDMDLDVDKMVNWLFDQDADARGAGYGIASGDWNGWQADGLLAADFGTYAFLTETYHTGETLAPMAKYDPRYSDAIGKWFLAASNSVRMFYPNELPAQNQIGGGPFAGDPKGVIAYEGVKKEANGQSPYAMGDPLQYGWGKTDYGIYGSATVGFFGSVIQATEVERILRLDLNAVDFFREQGSFPQYLYYNPYGEAKTVTVASDGRVPFDAFDVITKTSAASDENGILALTIPAKSSANIVLLPRDVTPVHDKGRWTANGLLIAKDAVAVSILSPSVQRQSVSGTVDMSLELTGASAGSADMTVSADGKVIYQGVYTSAYTLDTTALFDGLTDITVAVATPDGLTDKASVKLDINNVLPKDTIYTAGFDDLMAYTPVSSMPASVSDAGGGWVRITECNSDGNWGAVQSPPIAVDFNRTPYLQVETDQPDLAFTVQIKFDEDVWGQYVLASDTTPGVKSIDIKRALVSYNYLTKHTGLTNIRIYLLANNKEGASVNVRNVKLYYANRPIPGEDQNFTAENIASFAPGDSPATVELFGRSAIMPSNAGSSWGGLMSPSFNLNLDRNPQVNIDVEDIAPGGTFTLYFTIGGVNYYVYANQTGKGPQTADIKSWILRYQPGAVLSGALPTNVHIWATDKVGGWLIVNSISVTYPDTGQTVFSADKAAIERFGTSTVGPGKIGVVDAAARVTEANPGGDYGEVKSMEFFLDFDQNVTFSIDVAAVSNFWTARVQFDGEAYPSYMIANSRATGVTAVNMAEALGQYNAGFSKTGVQKVTLFLMANGGEGASVDVRGVTIKHTPKIPVIVEDAYFTAQQIAAFPAFDGVNGSAALSGGAAVVSSGARYYGGVVSPSFQIDFNRDPVLSIDVSDVSGMYFIQVQFSDQAYAYYTSLLNMTAPGPRTVDLRDSINALQAGAVDDGTGIKTVKVNIVAMNGDGSTGYNTVSVKSLSVTHGAAGEIPVQGISFDNPGADLRIGGQLPISVAYEPKMTTQRALDWSSSDEAVATVSSDGVVTAVGEGFAAIRAVSAVNPAISAVCAVSVSAGPLLTADYPAPCHTGSTYPINAVYQAAGSGFLPMAYASSAPDVVSVDSGGNMTVLKQGTAIVTITGICPTIEGKVSYSMTVSAESPLYGLIARVEEMFANNGLDANTAASVAALREALDAAKAVAGGEAVLQEDLDAAYNALSAALEGLRQASFNCGVKSMLAKIAKLQKIPFEWDGYGAALFATSNAAVCGVTPDGRLVPLKAGIAVITVTAPNGAKVLFAVTVTA